MQDSQSSTDHIQMQEEPSNPLIEIFFDLDGTLIRDGSIISIFYQLKKVNPDRFNEFLNNEEDIKVLVRETTNFLRPNLRETFQQLQKISDQYKNLVKFSIFTANQNIEFYTKVIKLLEKEFNTNIFDNFYLSLGFKNIEEKSKCKFQYIVDNNITVPFHMSNKLIKIKTFKPKELISENVQTIFKKYLLQYFYPNDEEKFSQAITTLLNDIEETQEQKDNQGFQPDTELFHIVGIVSDLINKHLDVYKKEIEEQQRAKEYTAALSSSLESNSTTDSQANDIDQKKQSISNLPYSQQQMQTSEIVTN